jgi:molybdopterin-biosynthesis enzyme MoeA-like protein
MHMTTCSMCTLIMCNQEDLQVAVQHRFVGQKHATKELFTSKGEGDIAEVMRKIAAENPKVHIGSYPNTEADDSDHKVKIVLKSRDAQKLREAAAAIEEVLAAV